MKLFCSNCGVVDMAWADDGSSGDVVVQEKLEGIDRTLRCYYCLDFTVEVLEDDKPKLKVFKGPTTLKEYEEAGE